MSDAHSTADAALGARAGAGDRPRLGVSECLLGEEVRYDGNHARDRYVTDVLARHVEWVPVCPEVEVGMGTPRESVRLHLRGNGGDERVVMVGVDSGEDWTDRMIVYSRRRTKDLREAELDGYVLKKNSPSCGMERVKLFDRNGVPGRGGVGLFAGVLMEEMPWLPVEEEGRLNDSDLRESFLVRIFAHRRWREMRQDGATPADLVRFHTAHKMLLLAHDEARTRRLGRLVAAAADGSLDERLDTYRDLMMEALSTPAPAGRHVNVIQHLSGFVKDRLDGEDKAELRVSLQEYRRGRVPLIAPLTLLGHHLRKTDHPWVREQVYLQPYPRELALRSFY